MMSSRRRSAHPPVVIALAMLTLAAVLGATPAMAGAGVPTQADDRGGTGPASEDPAVAEARAQAAAADRAREAAAEALAEAEAAVEARNQAVSAAQQRQAAASAERADAETRQTEAAEVVDTRITARDQARQRFADTERAVVRARQNLASAAISGYVNGKTGSLDALGPLLDADASDLGSTTVFDTVTQRLEAVRARAEDRRDDARDRLAGTTAALSEARAALGKASETLGRANDDLTTALSGLTEATAARAEATVARAEAADNRRVAAASQASARADLAEARAARDERRRRQAMAAIARINADDVNIPLIAVAAYRQAARTAPCAIRWWGLAGIGKVESNHGRYGGASLGPTGRATPEIIGVALNGSGGTARILDTDGGRLDHDTTYDRAVGPMQFIPTTWYRWRSDANGDGIADPHAIGDAAGAAARYLCASVRGDLTTYSALRSAYYSYNHSNLYVERVTAWARAYEAASASWGA